MLYFAGLICTGINNQYAMQRTIGLLCFFLLGYFSNEKVIRKAKRIPILIRGSVLMSVIIITFLLFSTQTISWNTLFYVLTHTSYITSFDNVLIGVGLYMLAFILAIVLSVIVLSCMTESTNMFTKIGENTLPLYIGHGFLVYLFITLLKTAHINNEFILLGILLTSSIITVSIFSSKVYRSLVVGALYKINRLVFKSKV